MEDGAWNKEDGGRKKDFTLKSNKSPSGRRLADYRMKNPCSFFLPPCSLSSENRLRNIEQFIHGERKIEEDDLGVSVAFDMHGRLSRI
jgi:hypothetical protein